MPVKRVVHSPKFQRSLHALPLDLIDKVVGRIALAQKDMFHPSLRTHKLHGKLLGLWSFSVDQKYRVIFELTRSSIILIDVGDHDVYQ